MYLVSGPTEIVCVSWFGTPFNVRTCTTWV